LFGKEYQLDTLLSYYALDTMAMDNRMGAAARLLVTFG